MPTLNRDGVSLHYEDAGRGEPPAVLIHGWCCDRSHLAPQLEELSRSRRTVAVDLRGHGDSDKPEQEYSVPIFADDVAWMAAELGLRRLVAVGHSMGGMVALDLAARYPDLVSAVVAIESAIVPPAALVDSVRPLFTALRSPGYKDVMRQFVGDGLFLPTDDRARREQVLGAMTCTPQHVASSSFEQHVLWDSAAAAAACKAPLLVISASGVLPDLARLRELCPHVVHGQTVGSGHFNTIEVPEQVNSMINRFLALSVQPA